ncbi:50S ribosomal protein L11 methyltransferase [Sphingorhabdus sp. Alg239-R122]|uniref:50S ribosomal protein L11 methyltransferase n=1 Tax=Sphingorhabdus sp. Alg239-R122 TaxID=2305989 RepID=UPI0013DC4528|nr:50S ribosomal protein L11 methyltransferase [Sphingorhabdus sp. Alg239-R122]
MSYKLTLPCTRTEAEALALVDFTDDAGMDNIPVIVTSEIDEQQPDDWEMHAYYNTKPTASDIRVLRQYVPSADMAKPSLEKLGNEDWLSMSQEGLEPIHAGRFHVHTPHMPASNDPAIRNFCIDAGLAFGTGHHETTHGCLAMLDIMRRRGIRCDNMLDLGTGTGLLAFAAGHLWPQARLTASDIDAVCEDVVHENARVNGTVLGQRRGQLHMVTADGMMHPALLERAPYDIIAANILAGPLIDMSADICRSIVPRGNLVLAGLLTEQAPAVLSAYRWQGMRLMKRIISGDWSILWMRKRGL